MAVNFEVKGMLARLLATEDIIVEHRKVDTACFNVQTRVLTLPLWEKASDNIYSMLVAHEVGHARETPSEDWRSNTKVPMQFVNVVEDARVEKLMKRRYGGLAKTFYSGYKELHEQDFFCISDENVSRMNLADRANLYFKIGNFLPINFSNKEREIVEMISATETFADVLKVAKILYDYCKKEVNESPTQKSPDTQEKRESSKTNAEASIDDDAYYDDYEAEDDSDEGEDSESSSENSEEVQTNSQGGQRDNDSEDPGTDENDGESETYGQSGANGSLDDKEPEVNTMNTLDEKIRDLVEKQANDTVYVEIPSVDLNTVIAKNSEVHKEIDECFNYQVQNVGREIFKSSDLEYRKFKISAQKEVNYLVKEFECKKAADSYARAATSRTGVLDCARLHSYKYSEDLFKKITTLADGKNHGLVFVLDWSGSMSNVILDTVKQLYNLIWFCKKVSLPFEVYAFTNEWCRPHYDYNLQKHVPVTLRPHYHKRTGLLIVEETFSMMNLLTSKVSTSVLEHQLINIWRLAYSHNNCYNNPYSNPSRLSLSGTPLNESLVCLHEILPKFQKDNKLQKVQCIVLTDGEAGGLGYYDEVYNRDGSSYINNRHFNMSKAFYLRDRKLGTTYSIKCSMYNYTQFTDVLLRNLRDKFPSVNFIGIRVLSSRDANRFITMYHNYGDKQYDKIQNDWKKLKSFTITKSGYHAYFGISSSALSQDAAFEVSENATKSQIKSAFVNSLKTKKTNKKILSEFISLIA